MISYCCSLINIGYFLLLNILFSGEVTVKQVVPEAAQPGEQFIVEIEVEKGNITGFAKLQQELPPGFTAEAVETQGGSFTFSDNVVKIIWMNLPSKKKMSITYKVSTDTTVNGTFNLTGKFSYLIDNNRKTSPFAPEKIVIGTPRETLADDRQSADEKDSITVKVNRAINYLEDNRYQVEITIEQQGIEGFAKIEDYLPEGASVSEGKADQAVFSSVDGKAKFVWLSFTSDQVVTASYILEAEIIDTALLSGMTGVFSYLENESTKRIDIHTSSLVPAPEDIQLAVNNVVDSNNNTVQDTSTADYSSAQQSNLADAGNNQDTQTNDTSNNKVINNIPGPETGISYHVQICAGHKQVGGNYFNNVYQFSEENVQTEDHEGWIKYTVGGYDQYRLARDRREALNANYKFPGPFVTAYNSGERITVQEALMISKQSWVQ